MKLIDYIKTMFSSEDESHLELIDLNEIASKAYIKTLAVETCINIIARVLSSCKFLTYEKFESVRSDIYYSLNVEPNKNQSATKFWHDVVSKLVNHNECLIIKQKDGLYVADSFDVIKSGAKPNIYHGIVINNISFLNKYMEKDVLHLELNNKNIKNTVEKMHKDMNSVLDKITNAGLKKYSVNIPASYPKDTKSMERLKGLLEQQLKEFLNGEKSSVIPLSDDITLQDFSDKNEVVKSSSNIMSVIEKEFEYTAIAFGIPKKLLLGEVADTDEVVNNLITFTIKPIAEMITDEVNRKIYGKSQYLKGDFVKFDTSKIKHVDITKIAGALDILVRIGAYSINDCLKELGMQEINEEWANKRYVTKNYEERGKDEA